MKNYSKIKKTNSGGFSLIELLIAIAVIAALTAIVFSNMGQATDSALIDREKQRILTLKRVISNAYGQLNSYNGLDNATMLAGSIIPNDMRAGVGEIQNSWLDAGYVLTPTNAGDTYTITSSGVPDDYCNDIGNAINPVTVEFETFTVNGANIANPPALAAACTNGANVLAWTARR
jgi:prepilin-type N-terminal cleavage/methylation domain-containing protein